jgi:hypothetical protein
MGKLVFGALKDAWAGEAADFTPLIAQQVDAIGEAIGIALAPVGASEVPTAGGRRIDILADGDGDTNFIIENQYGSLNHDHLTRGLAYAIAMHAQGLIVIAEKHRDEFREVATYLNELRSNDPERGVAVWLVEAKAVRIGDSAWAPLFLAVVSPNEFSAAVALQKANSRRRLDRADFDKLVSSPALLKLISDIFDTWDTDDRRHRIMANPPQTVLESRGPGVSGWRSVIGIYPDGKIAVPLGSYVGSHHGIPVEALSAEKFRKRANDLFGFDGTEILARTNSGWLNSVRVIELKQFANDVANAFLEALSLN